MPSLFSKILQSGGKKKINHPEVSTKQLSTNPHKLYYIMKSFEMCILIMGRNKSTSDLIIFLQI